MGFARNFANEALQDFSTGDISEQPERYAVEKALRAEGAALAEYGKILALFTDLFVHGKIPNEDEQQHKTAGEGE